jgi:peptidoglycan/xylan/chitin deacetylase (PgdA/CDA1 family)
MKGKGITTSKKRFSFREAITSVVVFGIVVGVPVFSLIEFGHYFRGPDPRSDDPLPAMVVRDVDKASKTPVLFQEPLISVTFDDGYESVYKEAMPLLHKYGIRTTQYVLGGTSDNREYVSWEQIKRMQESGHEIACHTMSHPDLTSLDLTNLEYEVGQCKTELTKRFGTVPNFASPYGAANDKTISVIKKYYESQRNTNGDPTNGVNSADVNLPDNFNRYSIIAVTVRNDTSIKQLQELVDFAKQNNGWIVLTYHQADQVSQSQFGVNPQDLEKQFSFLSKTNVRIVTVQDALAATRLKDSRF